MRRVRVGAGRRWKGRYALRVAVAGATLGAAFLAAGLGVTWRLGSQMAGGRRSAGRPSQAPAVDIRLHAADGVSIAGTYMPGAAGDGPGVLLLHGIGESRVATARTAAWLGGLGYATLRVDFRGHGQSDPAPRSFGYHEARDARAAFDWLQARQHGARIGVIGISLGGAAALLGEDGPLPAAALVLQAVYPDIRHAIRNRIAEILPRPLSLVLEPLLSLQSWPRFRVGPSRLSPISAVSRYGGAVLVIGGLEDRATPPAETRALFAAAGGSKELWLVPADHVETCRLNGEAYRARVGRFLAANLGVVRGA